ncbi:MAG TPA: DUF2283 domain-containing protein [bacterium]|nr:DUF2283 domain-containing protein [bacterium]HQP99663.1 DUF2283 domain-containing protein [bacterium]
MKLTVDRNADALYLLLDDSDVLESEEVSPGIVVDYNENNQVIGIEMLHLSKRTPKLDTGRLLFELAPELTVQ